jgi:hypothetical protein
LWQERSKAQRDGDARVLTLRLLRLERLRIGSGVKQHRAYVPTYALATFSLSALR